MAELVRHRQTKGSAPDRLHLNHRATPRLHRSQTTCMICAFTGHANRWRVPGYSQNSFRDGRSQPQAYRAWPAPNATALGRLIPFLVPVEADCPTTGVFPSDREERLLVL